MNKDSIVKKIGLTGIGLCVLCCSLPLLGMSIGIAAFTAVAFYLEKIGIILIGAAVILFFYSRLKKSETSPSCSADCSCKQQTSKNY
ncbi:MAG: hypothetical protein K0S09_776 [Sphingobacteriaceae bacterium]|jgi:hypothetical protein|nr:hypothetical protein [Sphingobacteriaceae bacterium]